MTWTSDSFYALKLFILKTVVQCLVMQLYLLKEHVLAFDASLKFVFSDEMFFAKLGEKVLLHCQDFGQESFISSGYSAS